MKPQEIEQLKHIISNFTEQHKHIPFVQELEEHPVFGPLFSNLTDSDKDKIQGIINEYIDEKMQQFKTKGGELFRRFYDVHTQLFRQFRKLNHAQSLTTTAEFQDIGKQVEQELFKYEGILTEKMVNRPEGLDKTLAAFYDIVYMFFPYYNAIQ